MTRRPVPVTVVIVTHNSERHIEAVVSRLIEDPAGPSQVIVVDNASDDRTREIVAGFAVDLVESPDNLGFPAGCNLGATKADQAALVFLNPDTEPHPGWLVPLLAALEEPGVGAAQPTLDLVDQPGHFFTSHSELTYLGFAWSTDAGQPIPPTHRGGDVAFPSGAALAIKRETFEALEGFRPGYFLYLEDVDLGWRLRLRGLRAVQVSESRVSHDYDFERHAKKMYYLERNRLRMVFANYRPSTLVLLSPALLAVELGIVAAAIKNHWFGDKAQGWKDLWRLRHEVAAEARQTQAQRRVSDREMIRTMGAEFRGITQISLPPFMGVIDRLMSWYQSVVVWVLGMGRSGGSRPSPRAQ
jgi:GT2 family glycosyltransferase